MIVCVSCDEKESCAKASNTVEFNEIVVVFHIGNTLISLFCCWLQEMEKKINAYNCRGVSLPFCLQDEMQKSNFEAILSVEQSCEIVQHKDAHFLSCLWILSNEKTNTKNSRDRNWLFKSFLGQRWAQNSR